MSADILAAVRQMLKDDIAIDDLVDGRVHGVSLTPAEVDVMSQNPRKNIVISRGGAVPSVGSASYVRVKRVRLDFRAYGEDSFEASTVSQAVDDFMKAIRAQLVELADGSAVHVDNAVESAGPIDMVDPDTDWPSVFTSWAVHYSEIPVTAPLVSS
jgi:hypothetical protein